MAEALLLASVIGLSFGGFLRIYGENPDLGVVERLEISIATALFLGAIMVAFSDKRPLVGGLITAIGLALSQISLGVRLPRLFGTTIAAVCFVMALSSLRPM